MTKIATITLLFIVSCFSISTAATQMERMELRGAVKVVYKEVEMLEGTYKNSSAWFFSNEGKLTSRKDTIDSPWQKGTSFIYFDEKERFLEEEENGQKRTYLYDESTYSYKTFEDKKVTFIGKLDKEGRILTSEQEGLQGEQKIKIIFEKEYDEKSKEKRVRIIQNGQLGAIYEREFDFNGRKKKEIISLYNSGKFIGKATLIFSYDERGFVKRIENQENPSHNQEFVYESYDEKGNWLKKTIYINGKIYQQEVRRITYYK